jgi:hypothetical protein
VPGLPAVKVNFSPVPSTLDLKTGPLLTTVWGMSSPFVQVICVPAFTVSAAGEKLKLSILTSAFAAATGAAATPGGAAWKLIKAVIPQDAKQKIHSALLRLVFLVFVPIISARLLQSVRIFTPRLNVQNLPAAVLFHQFLH